VTAALSVAYVLLGTPRVVRGSRTRTVVQVELETPHDYAFGELELRHAAPEHGLLDLSTVEVVSVEGVPMSRDAAAWLRANAEDVLAVAL
jgi:hypothetical protein